MAKPSKINSPVDPIAVSKIYETIRAKSYLKALWFDLISDIQEKPTYQHLKSMVNDVVNNSLQNLATKTDDINEELRRRSIITEIGIMTYTLDTVISEVLYQKYLKEFENIVKNLIRDILKGKQTEANNHDSVFENVERYFGEENPGSSGEKENDDTVNEATSFQNSNSSKDVEELNAAPARKRGRPKKKIVEEEKVEKMNAVPKSKRDRLLITPEKRIAASFNDKRKHEIPVQESDDESKMSVGNLSIDSVSSVHTSELSSFEDTISICSDEEGKKKHISLKVANEMYLRGKLSQIYQLEKKSERLKRMKEASISRNLTKTNNSSSRNVKFSPRKVLPHRIRKPNPKYNPETMFCVKGYSAPLVDTRSSSSEDEMDDKPHRSPNVQGKRKRLNLGKRTYSRPASNISASKGIKKNNFPQSKTSTKCYTTSDLYKPRPVTGSFVGSRSTAVTSLSV